MSGSDSRYIRIGDVKRWRIMTNDKVYWGEYSYFGTDELQDLVDSHMSFSPIKEKTPSIIVSSFVTPTAEFFSEKEVQTLINTLISDHEAEIRQPKIVREWTV